MYVIYNYIRVNTQYTYICKSYIHNYLPNYIIIYICIYTYMSYIIIYMNTHTHTHTYIPRRRNRRVPAGEVGVARRSRTASYLPATSSRRARPTRQVQEPRRATTLANAPWLHMLPRGGVGGSPRT